MNTQLYYYNLRDAISTLSLHNVKQTLEQCRQHCLANARKQGLLTGQEAATQSFGKMIVHSVIESRSGDDITPFIYACLLYRSKALEGDRIACRALDVIAGWLIEEGATVFAQGKRQMVRVGLRNGRPAYARGEGKNVVEALGQANLPPSVQKYISELREDYYERFEDRVMERRSERNCSTRSLANA